MTHRSVAGEFREFIREVIYHRQYLASDTWRDSNDTVKGDATKTYFLKPVQVEARDMIRDVIIPMVVAGNTDVKYGLYFDGKLELKYQVEVEANKNARLTFTGDDYPSGKYVVRKNGTVAIGIQGAGNIPVSGEPFTTDTILPEAVNVDGGYVRGLVNMLKFDTAYPYRDFEQKFIGIAASESNNVIVSTGPERIKPYGLGDAIDPTAKMLHELSASIDIKIKGEYNLQKTMSNILTQINANTDAVYTGRFGNVRFFDVKVSNINDQSKERRNARRVIIDVVGKCYSPQGILI